MKQVDQFLANFHVTEPRQGFIPKRTICLPVDESEYSLNTIHWTIKHIIQPGDLVLLLHVRPETTSNADLFAGALVNYHDAYQEIVQKQRETSQELLRGYSGIFKGHQVEVEALSLVGDPRHALVEKILEVKPTMVCVGQRGMGALSRIVIGSVSDHLVHHVHCPVLVVTK